MYDRTYDRVTESMQEVAHDALEHFESATRADGAEFLRLDDTTPQWVKDLVQAAHGTDATGAPAMLPDDHKYEFAMRALGEIEDAQVDEDIAEVRDRATEPSIYTHELTTWLGSHGYRPDYVDEAVEELGGDTTGNLGIIARLGLGQSIEKGEVFDIVLGIVVERADEADDAKEADAE